jgi:hypothetical protein
LGQAEEEHLALSAPPITVGGADGVQNIAERSVLQFQRQRADPEGGDPLDDEAYARRLRQFLDGRVDVGVP